MAYRIGIDASEAAILRWHHAANGQRQEVKAQFELLNARVHRPGHGTEHVSAEVHRGEGERVVGGVQRVGDDQAVIRA